MGKFDTQGLNDLDIKYLRLISAIITTGASERVGIGRIALIDNVYTGISNRPNLRVVHGAAAHNPTSEATIIACLHKLEADGFLKSHSSETKSVIRIKVAEGKKSASRETFYTLTEKGVAFLNEYNKAHGIAFTGITPPTP